MISSKPEREDYYFDEKGLMVFTKRYHIKRGYCCGKGCRHCPYDHQNVPKKDQHVHQQKEKK